MKNIEKHLEQIACLIADGGGPVCRIFSDGYEDGVNICDSCPLDRICNDKDKLIQWLKSNVVQNDEKQLVIVTYEMLSNFIYSIVNGEAVDAEIDSIEELLDYLNEHCNECCMYLVD